MPRSRMCGAVPPLPQYAFIIWCSVEAQGQLNPYLLLNTVLGMEGKFVIKSTWQ